MKNKKTGKITPKKGQDKKSDANHLTVFLMEKHNKQVEKKDRVSQTALLLETVLTGSDQQLRKVVEYWSDSQAIGQVVRGWGSGHSILLFQRLTLLLEDQCRCVIPWISELLKLKIEFNASDIDRLRKYSNNQDLSNLSQVLRFEGKLLMFEA